MDETDPILYMNYSSKFFCEAVAFLFADDLKFSIEFTNGTRRFAECKDGRSILQLSYKMNVIQGRW